MVAARHRFRSALCAGAGAGGHRRRAAGAAGAGPPARSARPGRHPLRRRQGHRGDRGEGASGSALLAAAGQTPACARAGRRWRRGGPAQARTGRHLPLRPLLVAAADRADPRPRARGHAEADAGRPAAVRLPSARPGRQLDRPRHRTAPAGAAGARRPRQPRWQAGARHALPGQRQGRLRLEDRRHPLRRQPRCAQRRPAGAARPPAHRAGRGPTAGGPDPVRRIHLDRAARRAALRPGAAARRQSAEGAGDRRARPWRPPRRHPRRPARSQRLPAAAAAAARALQRRLRHADPAAAQAGFAADQGQRGGQRHRATRCQATRRRTGHPLERPAAAGGPGRPGTGQPRRAQGQRQRRRVPRRRRRRHRPAGQAREAGAEPGRHRAADHPAHAATETGTRRPAGARHAGAAAGPGLAGRSKRRPTRPRPVVRRLGRRPGFRHRQQRQPAAERPGRHAGDPPAGGQAARTRGQRPRQAAPVVQ